MDGPALEILCVRSEKYEDSMETGALQCVVPLAKAKEKVMQLLEAVVRGEVEYFAVNLHKELPPPKKGKKLA